ncbi:nucleolar protein 14 homolog [Diorhabda sublineata]|uniref:nucleolar protein 14 homolog n=1 Tax=Diorhabda sublineata TaxID=1163346 RepID=UPI0024E05FDC|nr:nucleolar protein 14 homolog [Diorhabda sublineata]
MAKSKKKNRMSSERVHLKKEPKKMNPFEIHVNKEKLRVLGKKQKNDKGLPGVARAKAIQKRKSTLLQEYEVQNKTNTFLDRRIGEKGKMDFEEKAIARFTALKVKNHNKKSIFNLADDEILTHKGQTLSEIEKFDDPRSDDEDFFDKGPKTGNLVSDFVEEAHFGGGLFKNTGKEGAMTHKDLINQLIVESKKRKAEKQKLKEATLELTEKLDTEWKDLIPLVNSNTQKTEDEPKKKIDDYDKVMRELKFEKRGTVSDRLKSEDELAKEEKENLAKLEQERLERMNSSEDKPKQYHRSADDLDDGFVFNSDNEDIQENMLSYNPEGESNLPIEANVNGTILKANKNTEEAEDDIEEESSEEETDSEDNLSDLKEDSDSETESFGVEKENEEKMENDEKIDYKNDKDANISNESSKSRDIKKEIASNETIGLKKSDKTTSSEDNSNKKGVNEGDIPFTFDLPNSYEDLLESLEKYENYEDLVLQRMIKCNHPSLSETNKSKLGLLFAYVLQYLNDLFCEQMDEKKTKKHYCIFQSLVPQIYELAKLNPENAHKSIIEVIKEKFEEFKKKPRIYPGLEILIFFKLVSVLFSTSDFRHQIVTPCYIFMEQILTKCKAKDRHSISYGLFVSTMILEYSALSKRYLPAVINYLSGLLHMAVPKASVKLLKIPPPFKSTSSHLVLVDNYSSEVFESMKMKTTDFSQQEINGDYQVRVLYTVVKLLEQFLEHYKVLPSNVEIFEPVLKHIQLIPCNYYPEIVQNNLNNLITLLEKIKEERRLTYLVMEISKPKALRLYEPKIQVIYDGKQHKYQSKEKAQHSKLIHKLKREKKGALREIRRDNAFLGRVKINKQIQSDSERRDKVKRIFSEAAVQQSELNAIDRKKKKKH